MEYFVGTEAAVIIIALICAIYYFLLHRLGILKPAVAASAVAVSSTPNPPATILPIMGAASSEPPSMSLPTLAEEPTINWEEMEMKADEENILLKEAERIVERIQDTIDHIASNPPNPEEITTKIRALVAPYQLLLETEYYDSINTYIALAVERDCAIRLLPEQLAALWN